MFRSIWSKTLRDYRIPILAWGIGLAILLYAELTGSSSLVKDPNSQASFAQFIGSFKFFGDPTAITTPEGYATWRIMDVATPVLLSIWALLAGARMVRGEEERGTMDVLLATPHSRTRLLLEKIGAFVIALLVIGILLGLGGIAGEASVNTSFEAGRPLLAGLNVSLFAFLIGMFALLLSQILRSRGAAAGITGAILVLSFLFDGTGRVVDNAGWLQALSPLHYYVLNKPLIPSVAANVGGPLLLLGLSLLFGLLGIALFVRRDIGGIAWPSFGQSTVAMARNGRLRALNRAERDVFIRSISLRGFRAQLAPLFWWLLGIAVWVVWLTSLIPSLEAPLQKIFGQNPTIGKVFNGLNAGTNAGFLSSLVYQFVILLIVFFALVIALKWSSDLDAGHLELVLATPKSRTRILLERFAAVLVGTILGSVIVWLGVLLAALAINIKVNAGNVAAAGFGMLPLELVLATFVFAVAERLRYGAILGIASLYIIAAFFVELLKSLFNLPNWVLSFSIFHQYGNPIVDGMQWGPFPGMLGVALVLLVIGLVQFRQVDIERGS